MQTIEERIEALERSNRRLRGAGVVCGILLVGVLVVGANQEAEPKRHVYEDLYAKSLTIGDPIGRPYVTLKTGSRGGELMLHGHDMDAFSVVTPTHLMMTNLEGHTFFNVGINDNNDGFVSTYSKQGKELVELTSAGSGGSITTYNGQGKELVRLGVSKGNGSGAVTTFNSEGKELVKLGVTVGDGLFGGTGIVAVHDPTGRTKRGQLTTRE